MYLSIYEISGKNAGKDVKNIRNTIIFKKLRDYIFDLEEEMAKYNYIFSNNKTLMLSQNMFIRFSKLLNFFDET